MADRWTRPELLVDLARAGHLWTGDQHDARRKPRRYLHIPDWREWSWRALSPREVYGHLAGCVRLVRDLEGERLPWGEAEAGQLFEVHQYGRALPVPRVVARVTCPVKGRRWVAGEPKA